MLHFCTNTLLAQERIITHRISVSSAALILLISLSFILALFAERATSERAVQHRKVKIATRVSAKCGTPCNYFFFHLHLLNFLFLASLTLV